jgi:DNA repair exonuclease SbcCD ATPase subunit
MAEDDEKSASVALPRCVCNWKGCRSYMRNFRDSEPPHEAFNGVIKMKIKQTDEKSMKLKEAWDRYLQPEDSKSENWKDGEVKYNVARHHFTETMLQEYLQNKKSWDWTALVPEDDAEYWLFALSDEDSSPISDTEMGYLKVPNVSKQHVKSFASDWVLENPSNNMHKRGSDHSSSNLSVMSSKSASKPPKVGTRKQKDKVKKVTGGSLAGLENLPSASDHSTTKKSPKPGESARKKSSSGGEKSPASRSRKKVTSDDASVKSSKSRTKSPKRTKDKTKAPEENLEGKLLSVPSLDEAEENGNSNKEAEVAVAAAAAAAAAAADEEIKKLKSDLSEEQAKVESALEDLGGSKKEIEALRKEIRKLTEARVRDKEEAGNSVLSAQSSIGDTTALQSEIEDLKAQNAKLQNLSEKRLNMVTEMDNKYKGEIDVGLTREQELKTQLSARVSKAEDAEKETEKLKAELSSVQKEMEELRESHTSETEDFINGVDNLKKRIVSLEEEHSNLLAEVDAGKKKSRKLEATKQSEKTRVTELEAEVDQLKERSRKLAVMGTPSGPDNDLQQTIETLQKEKDVIVAEKEKLAKLNQNQKKIIRSLEGATGKDNDETRKNSQREDDLERGAALLANIYFTQKNMGGLTEQNANMSLRDLGVNSEDSTGGDQQALLLKDVMEQKQKKWWGSLDGIFSSSNHAEEDVMKEIAAGAQ